MDYVPPGFDEDKYFGDEGDCAPLTTEAMAALIAYDIELARMAASQPAPPVTW